MINTAKYKEEGRQAYRNGKTLDDNPYHLTNMEKPYREAWASGFMDEKEAFETDRTNG